MNTKMYWAREGKEISQKKSDEYLLEMKLDNKVCLRHNKGLDKGRCPPPWNQKVQRKNRPK